MDIRRTFHKGREQETDVGNTDHPVLNAHADAVLVSAIAKSRFGEIHRTDGAQKIGKDLLGLINFQVIVRLGDDIICIVKDEDEVVADIIIVFDDHIVQMLQ